MITLLNYTNTKVDLETTRLRLSILMDKKEELYCRYLGITAKLKDIVVTGGNISNDKMADYLNELHKIDPNTGKSLEQEINEQLATIQKLEYYLKQIETNINSLTGIEADLYKEIVVNGTKVSKAVEKVADKNNREPRTIWRIYHREVKELIYKLKKN